MTPVFLNISHMYLVTGPRSKSLGASFVIEDWQVRVFGSSGLVYRTSECLSIQTIHWSGFVDRLTCYILLIVRIILSDKNISISALTENSALCGRVKFGE